MNRSVFSTSSAASGDSPSDLSEPECEPSRSVKSTPTAGESSQNTGQVSPVTTTSEPSTRQQRMSFAEDSHVRTSASPEAEKDWPAHAAAFGLNRRELLAQYDPNSHSWKTSQLCLNGEWETFSETWPESGTTRSGQLFQRAPWVPHMCDDECSLWPTPTASMDGRGFGIPLHARGGRYKRTTVRRVQEMVGEHGWRIHPNFTEALMGFPLEWTAIEQSEMRSFQTSRKSSDAPS